MDLVNKHCVPCEKGTPPISNNREEELIQHTPDWQLLRAEPHKITRQFKFKDFKQALAFVNKVANVAESEGHHPDIKIVYNKVQLELFTHAVGGLSENDFIMAAKIDTLV